MIINWVKCLNKFSTTKSNQTAAALLFRIAKVAHNEIQKTPFQQAGRVRASSLTLLRCLCRKDILHAGSRLLESNRVHLHILLLLAVHNILEWNLLVKLFVLLPSWLVFVQRDLIRIVLFEILCEFHDLIVWLDVLWVGWVVAVELLNPLSRLGRAIPFHGLDDRLVLREEVSPLPFEFQWVIERAGSFGALQVEPEHGVKNTLVDDNAIIECLLEHAVHIILLKHSAFTLLLLWRLVKGIH